MIRWVPLWTVLLILGISVSGVSAAEVERPPSRNAGKILGNAARGPNYTIKSPVTSDGYLRNYEIVTPYGEFRASGDEMLLMRIKELKALSALEQTSSSQEFADAVAKAGLSPVKYTSNLLTNPVGTVGGTISGVGKLFGGIVSGVKNAGKTQDRALSNVTGASKQKRLIAYKYGVDPYTDFQPLADKLKQLSEAAAAGGLVVSAAFIAIPGAAGSAISHVSTAQTLNETVRDYSAAQLLDMNRKKLTSLGIERDLIDELLHNKHYTPLDATALVEALTQLKGIQNLDLMVDRAGSVDSRDVALFMRRRIELTATYQKETRGLLQFVRFGDAPFPLIITTDRGVAGIFPIDLLSWT